MAVREFVWKGNPHLHTTVGKTTVIRCLAEEATMDPNALILDEVCARPNTVIRCMTEEAVKALRAYADMIVLDRRHHWMLGRFEKFGPDICFRPVWRDGQIRQFVWDQTELYREKGYDIFDLDACGFNEHDIGPIEDLYQ